MKIANYLIFYLFISKNETGVSNRRILKSTPEKSILREEERERDSLIKATNPETMNDLSCPSQPDSGLSS